MLVACTQRTTFKSHEGAPSSSGAAEGLSGPELVGEHRTSNPQLGACRMWVSMRLGSLMLCSCACQAAFLTNPFDRCKPTRAMSLWQVNDLLLLLPRSELVTLNEHTDGPGDHLVGVLGCMGMAVFSRQCVMVCREEGL